MAKLLRNLLGYEPTENQIKKAYSRYGSAEEFEHYLTKIYMAVPYKSDKLERATIEWLERYM